MSTLLCSPQNDTTHPRRLSFLSRLTAFHDIHDPKDTATMPSVSDFPELQALLATNESWAKNTAENDPELLPTLATGQKPGFLWIGCADSRVPETTVLGKKPGDVFVHVSALRAGYFAVLGTPASGRRAVGNGVAGTGRLVSRYREDIRWR